METLKIDSNQNKRIKYEKPAMQLGKNIKMRYIIPVELRLDTGN
jgi:hypothetical protein